MIGLLFIIPFIISVLGIFILRYLIGVITFWGKQYLKQGYHILHSDRSAFYLLDTGVIYSLSIIYLFVHRYHSSLSQMWAMGSLKSPLFLMLLMLCTLPFRKSCVFYNGQGILIVKPFQEPHLVPWNQLEGIQKWRFHRKYHVVLGQNGMRLAVFSLNRKTQQFIDLARQNGVSMGKL